jgi:hypothetical protein
MNLRVQAFRSVAGQISFRSLNEKNDSCVNIFIFSIYEFSISLAAAPILFLQRYQLFDARLPALMTVESRELQRQLLNFFRTISRPRRMISCDFILDVTTNLQSAKSSSITS